MPIKRRWFMDLKKIRDLLEWPVMIFFLVGIVTAALNLTIAGFTPIVWFVISLWSLIMIICMETSMIRRNLEKKNQEKEA